MNWFTIIPLLLLVAVNHFTEATTESNEIFPTGTTQTKGRTKLRRLVIPIEPADDAESSLGSSNNVENATNKDEILEESTVRDKMSVHFYSANVDTETNTEGDLLKYLLEKVGSPANNDSKLFIKYSPTERSVSTTAAADSEINSSNDIPAISRNSVKKDEQKKSKESKSQIEEPTTTSKPAPTHNEDGENIEVVDKKDIKILQAPLVSAFTVHQDGIGLPKKVIPLIPSALQPTPIPVVQLSSISFPGRSPFVQSNLISPTESPLINHQPIPLQLPVPSFLRPEALQKHYNELRGGFIQQPSITPNPISLPIQQQVSQPARDLLPPLNAIPTQSIQQIQPVPQIIPAQSIQQIQPVPQIIPTFSVLPQQPAIIQNQQQLQLQQALLERQKLLEEQIFLLQNQARHQQQQIFLQQQLLQEHRRKRFENESGQPNQLTANNVISGKSKLINEIPQVTSKPQLEIFKSVTQAPRYEVSTQQHLPVREAVPFHRNPATFNQQSSKSAKVEIQASTQLNVNQSQQKNAASPRELSSTLQLPLRSFQAFRLNGNQNAGAQAQQQQLLQQQLLQQQQQQQQQQYQQQYQQQLFQRQQQALLQQQQQQQQQLFQQQILQAQQQQIARNRNFRSELQTGNFGLNSNFIPQQSFAPQTTPADIQLQSLLYQSALNHGINPRIPQNLQIPFPFGNF